MFGGYEQEFGQRRLKLGHEIWTWTPTRENSKPRTWIWTWIQTCVSAELWCRTAFDFRTIWVTCVNLLLTMSTYCYTINDSVTIKCYKCILLNSHFRSTSFPNRSTNFEISYVSMKKLVRHMVLLVLKARVQASTDADTPFVHSHQLQLIELYKMVVYNGVTCGGTW